MLYTPQKLTTKLWKGYFWQTSPLPQLYMIQFLAPFPSEVFDQSVKKFVTGTFYWQPRNFYVTSRICVFIFKAKQIVCIEIETWVILPGGFVGLARTNFLISLCYKTKQNKKRDGDTVLNSRRVVSTLIIFFHLTLHCFDKLIILSLHFLSLCQNFDTLMIFPEALDTLIILPTF